MKSGALFHSTWGSIFAFALTGCGASGATEPVAQESAAFDAACAALAPVATFNNTFDYTATTPYPAGCAHGVVLKVDGLDVSPNTLSSAGAPGAQWSRIEAKWAGTPSSQTTSPCGTTTLTLEAWETNQRTLAPSRTALELASQSLDSSVRKPSALTDTDSADLVGRSIEKGAQSNS
ncbi:MAG: hypothetical protein ACOY0T_27630 [Myxococcota bacterium]